MIKNKCVDQFLQTEQRINNIHYIIPLSVFNDKIYMRHIE